MSKDVERESLIRSSSRRLTFGPLTLGTRSWFFVLGSLIAAHAAFSILAGGSQLTFLSGGSDAPAYALLASNLLHHQGYTYAGEPTAMRPPGYPVFLAILGFLFHRWYIVAVRFIQFWVCLATAWLCGRCAKELFHDRAGSAAFLLALLLPTQIFASAQVLTECLATFFVALFLYFLVREMKSPASRTEAGMGAAAAAATYLRFNSAALPLFAGIAIYRFTGRRRLIAIGGSMVLPLLLLSPWLVRNLVVFHGKALFSTQGGLNALVGVLTPEGRGQAGDTQKLQHAVGWVLSDVETNNPSRRSLPSEVVLDQECLRVVPGVWKTLGWRAAPLLMKKVADFWLGTDQIFETRALSLSGRLIRLSGVMVYWCVLGFAIAGWRRLRTSNPRAAMLLLAYAAIYTLLHLPLTMNTRIRFPLMDPLVAALAGGGLFHWSEATKRKKLPAASEH